MQLKTLHRRKRKHFLLIFLLIAVEMTKMYAQTRSIQSINPTREYTERIYVTENGAGTKNGDSWENAMDSLQLAVVIANENYNTYGNRTDVWVAEGTYYGDSIAANNAFTIKAGVNVYGGFAGTETTIEEREIEAHPTILDGQNVQRVLSAMGGFSESSSVTWDGFIIENGKLTYSTNNYYYGAGAYLRQNQNLKNCIIRNNSLIVNGWYGSSGTKYASGAGVYISNATLENCDIFSNIISCNMYTYARGGGVYADNATLSNMDVYNNHVLGSSYNNNNLGWVGGGIYVYSNTIISYCKIYDNDAGSDSGYDGYSGGLHIQSTGVSVVNCQIGQNQAENYGGVYAATGSVMMGCLVANNSAQYYGGLYCQDASFYNCTFANNLNTASNDGIYSSSNGIMTNCIVWGNKKNDGTTISLSGSWAATYSAIEGGYAGMGNLALSNQNTEDVLSPYFSNPAAGAGVNYSGNWSLDEDSPCINAGTLSGLPDSFPEIDLAGNTRVQQGKIDMGAYESPYTKTEITPDANNIIYVTSTGAGALDGSSWQNAVSSISLAVSVASIHSPISTVWVAEGTYTGDSIANHNAFVIQEGVNVYGGFAGTETSLEERDLEQHYTILDGQNVQRVLCQLTAFTDTTTAVWDGFIIENGREFVEQKGGGVYLRANGTLKNCIIRNNVASGSNASGGGVYKTSGVLENCEIYGNSLNGSTLYGGGVYSTGGSLVNCNIYNHSIVGSYRDYGSGVYAMGTRVAGCIIRNNTGAHGEGGGIYASPSTTIINSIVEGNKHQSGGGIYCYGSSGYVRIINCVIANNYATSTDTSGGGGINASSNTYIINCDIVNNSMPAGGKGAGVWGNSSTITNSVIWGNKKGNAEGNIYFFNGITITYSAIEGGYEGTGNIALSSQNTGNAMSPLFTAPSEGVGIGYSNGDWTLQEGSSLINRGDNNAVNLPDLDLVGNERIQQGKVDMGAYESPYAPSQLPNYENNIIYVKVDGNGNGTSWDNAMGSLQNAVQTAFFIEDQNPAPQIWVAEGTYIGDGNSSKSAFYMLENVNVYGGFSGFETSLEERNSISHPTILDGQQVQQVLLQQSDFTDTTSTIWDGFIIENGQLSPGYGAGAYIKKFGTLKNCIIRNNTVSGSSSVQYGGGVYLSYGTLEDCDVYGNRSSGDWWTSKGGGVYSSYGMISNCKVHNNTAQQGGGVCAEGAISNRAIIKDSYIENNTSISHGGGMYLNYSTLINTIVSDNRTSTGNGGGLYASNSIITNCDIVNNTITGSNNSGAGISGNSNTLKNTIVWGNRLGTALNNIPNNVGSITYCAVEGGYTGTGNVALVSENTGDYTTGNYVCFANPENGDYHLLPYSACINAGSNDANTQEYDLEGNARIWNDTIDIGAYEFREIIHFVDTSAVACDSLLWHDQTIVSSGIYVDTLTNQYGNDSIIALHLTINPSYHPNLYETACDTFYWGNVPYTESGEYINEYQSVYDCDSIVTMHLTINHTRPLGNFTYMSPVNDYINHYAEIDFVWDAVPNADGYDFYLWQGDDGRPSAPVVAGLASAAYHLEGIQHNATYHWCVVAKNECVETESPERTFTCQLLPMLSVIPQDIVDFGEIELGQSRTKTIAVSATALPENIHYSFLNNASGQGVGSFSIRPSSNWNPASGGSLQVTFTPNATHLYYDVALRIASGTLADTIYLTGSLANRYVFSTNVEEPVYSANDEIAITGHVEDVLGHAVSNLDVDVYLIVMGSRIILPTVSDANGDYSVVYTPRYSEAGYYKVGSCEKGRNVSTVHDAFDIPGIGRVSSDFIIWQVPQNNTLTGTVKIRNRSRIPLGNIQVTPVSLPDGCTADFMGTYLGSLETGELHYVISGTELSTGLDYEEATFLLTSDAGITMNLTCYYYCYRGRGTLDVYPYSVATTMRRNSQKLLSFQIANNGTGETGPITIGLPNVDWMSVMGGNTLESVPAGDSCSFTIQLAPDDNVSLNKYTGSIAVNCANGNGFSIPYELEATADSTGALVVDVTDDYTWNTNGGNGPHLAGAKVTLKGFYSLDTIAQGVTGEDGHFIALDLPEGYYYLTVQAPSHKEYKNGIIYIEAGMMHWKEVYLQFQAITYSYVVVPTEIPDIYEYELVTEIKTNVPVPVVVMDYPKVMDTLAYGDSLQFDITLTNYGLIDAYEAQIVPPTQIEEYDFYPLFDYIDTLHAQTSVTIPCIMTRTQRGRADRNSDCQHGHWSRQDYWYCNRHQVWELHKDSVYIWNNCLENTPPRPHPGDSIDKPRPIIEPPFRWPWHWPDSIPHILPDSLPIHLPPLPPLPDITTIIPHNNVEYVTPTSDEDCYPCWKVWATIIVDLVEVFVPRFSRITCFIDAGFETSENIGDFMEASADMMQCLDDEAADHVVEEVVEEIGGRIAVIFTVVNFVTELREVYRKIHNCVRYRSNELTAEAGVALDQLEHCTGYYQSLLNRMTNLFQEEEWVQEKNLSGFLMNFYNVMDNTNYLVSPQSVQQLKETCEMSYVNDSIIQRFADRWNRTVQYWNEGYYTIADLPIGYDTNFVQIDTMIMVPAHEAIEAAEAYGFKSVGEMLESSTRVLKNVALEHNNDVCAKVSVSFKQTMTMTREAFEGTLKIYNGHEADAMENIDVNVVIKDSHGEDKTSLFQINVISLDQISGVDGTGMLGAMDEGIVQFQMIPTISAAPDTSMIYSFGGSFSFLDPFSGETMTYQLYPVELTVNPSPNLHIDYFVQRNIISDDPLTQDTIESVEPAEIAMMISNVGAGDANNVYLESSQPRIVDNQNGLLIQFDMIGASMNGEQRQLGLINIPFGTISSHSASVAEWYYTSSLMARVIHSTPRVIHNNSYNNTNLSLVTEVNAHELIKAISAYGSLEDGINDFLVNETDDFSHTPDKIYFSHGGTASVNKIIEVHVVGTLSETNDVVLLQVTPIAEGWNYACIDDPAQGLRQILSCTRDDGQEIPLSNVWVSHVTMPYDGAPIHENKLHIVDTVASNQVTTYTLVYGDNPFSLRVFNGYVDVYWSKPTNWVGRVVPQADDEVLINDTCLLDRNATVFSLTIAENQSLTIPASKILTVTGDLINTLPSGLVIEDGAQLIHDSEDVIATVKKYIVGYDTLVRGRFCVIANPLVSSVDSEDTSTYITSGNYDLYGWLAGSPDSLEWRNYKYEGGRFNLEAAKGYLYANQDNVELSFPGVLRPSDDRFGVSVNYVAGEDFHYNGWNLIGNPFACEAYLVDEEGNPLPYYRMKASGRDFEAASGPIAPMESVFYVATESGMVYFTRNAPVQEEEPLEK